MELEGQAQSSSSVFGFAQQAVAEILAIVAAVAVAAVHAVGRKAEEVAADKTAEVVAGSERRALLASTLRYLAVCRSKDEDSPRSCAHT